MKERFADRPWLDVVSKGDLLSPAPPPTELSSNNLELYALLGPARAIRVSVQTGQGLDVLVQRVHSLLSAHSKSLHENIGDHSTRIDGDNSEQDGQRSQSKNYRNYSPAWPNVQG
jgi:nucleolar GTP-binding protein